MSDRVLIVDDETNIRKVLKALVEQQGYLASEARDGMEAISCLKKEEIHTIITDLRMPHLDGMGLLKKVSDQYPDIPVIVITAHETVDSAVSALKLGAFDYISKPFEKQEMVQVIEKAINTYQSKSRSPSDLEIHSDLISQSPKMKEVLKIIQKVSDSPSTVLITGESGTGKELVARALHNLSSRSQNPFIAINCSAIPSTLIESELFGYERGAFTGAVSSKPGRFELANHGTLFLDEIGEISPEMQAKLLRVLQNGEIERVGGIQTLKIDIRLISATNKELMEEVKKGNFRQDLYYRLNVVPIDLPPLRERLEDFPPLIHFFIEKYSKKLGKKIQEVDKTAMEILSQFGWPGNIRQLENVIERMILLNEDTYLTVKSIPTEILETIRNAFSPVPAPPSPSFKKIVRETMQKIEKELILKALEEKHGNVTQAAKKLGISRKSLQNKIRDYQLSRKLISERNEHAV